MNGDPLFWTALAALGLTSLAAIGVRSLRDFSRSELQEICKRNHRLERFGQIARKHEITALGVGMLGAIAAALFVGSAVCWRLSLLDDPTNLSWQSVVVIALLVGVVLAFFRVGIPWSIARVCAAPFVFYTWSFWRALGGITIPLWFLITLFDGVLHRLVGREPKAPDEESIEEEIRAIVTEGHREGLLEEDAREMIEGVIELGEGDVSHIMTPRTDMHMLHADLSWDEMLADVIEAGHTRIPVFDKNRDDLIGVLYVKDLLPEFVRRGAIPTGNGSQGHSVRDLVRKPIFVPETKAVDDLLEMFRQERTHIAIVLDEYGGVSGLVTIEDVLEEIVGDIVDEYDDDVEEEILSLEEGACEAMGRAHVDEINEVMGFSLPENDDYDTIAGFVFTQLGHVPDVGEQIIWKDLLRVTVLEATRRRIERVRIEQIETTTESA